MSEPESTSGVQVKEAPANGTNGHVAPAITPDEVIPPKGTPPPAATPEQIGKLIAEVEKMPDEKQLELKRVLLKRLQAEVGETSAEPAKEKEKPVDPGEFDERMIRIKPALLPEFTREAMERSAYQHEGVKVYPPFDGLFEERIERPNGDVFYIFKLSAPFLCENSYGELVTVPRGKIFIVAASTSMRMQLDPVFEQQKLLGGKAHVRGRPLRWGMNGTGKAGIVWDCRVHPDEEDKTKPKMFDLADE